MEWIYSTISLLFLISTLTIFSISCSIDNIRVKPIVIYFVIWLIISLILAILHIKGFVDMKHFFIVGITY